MNKPAAFIVVENGQTWLRTSAETEEAIRTGFIMETIPLYTAPPKPLTPREALSEEAVGELLMGGFSTHLIDLVRMIEKAHGIGGE